MAHIDSLTVERINADLAKLQNSIEGTDTCMVDIYEGQEKLEDRINELEEEVTAVKVQYVDIRTHLRGAIKQLNEIAYFVNEKHGFEVISETKEIDEP